jgi:hypothetical protein
MNFAILFTLLTGNNVIGGNYYKPLTTIKRIGMHEKDIGQRLFEKFFQCYSHTVLVYFSSMIDGPATRRAEC